MTTPVETAYPRLKTNPSIKELEEVYTPTEAELAFVKQTVQRPLSRLAVLIHLKLFQRLQALHFRAPRITPFAAEGDVQTRHWRQRQAF